MVGPTIGGKPDLAGLRHLRSQGAMGGNIPYTYRTGLVSRHELDRFPPRPA